MNNVIFLRDGLPDHPGKLQSRVSIKLDGLPGLNQTGKRDIWARH
ncbi:MAG: hypothetical protein AB2700_16010 [Candidatus Thiodiazotropha taylori]